MVCHCLTSNVHSNISQFSHVTIIEIRPFRNDWKCFDAPGVEPVFLTQEDAIGYAQARASLFTDSIGNFNTGVGGGALLYNNADSNTAVGAAALLLNTTGSQNTKVITASDAHSSQTRGAKTNSPDAFSDLG
jgi:hypothetical protein